MIFKLSLFLSFILCGFFSPFLKEDKNISSFKKTLHHPGLKKGEEQTLTFKVNKNTGKVTSKVASVMCYTNQCKIITVTLEWDQYGEFSKLIIPERLDLEKHLDDKTMAFTKQDYKKLHSILKDDESILSDVTKDDLYVEDENDLDGYSGATKAFIGKKDVVQGATLTCFTLWHWANHPVIKQAIREKSIKNQTEESLKKLMTIQKATTTLFALEVITEKGYNIEDYWSYYLNVADDLTGREIRMLLNLSDASQKLALFQHLNNMSLRRIVLISIFKEKAYHNQLLDYIKMENYQEVTLFLDFLSEFKIENEVITEKLLPYLDGKDVLISRNIYWYLKGLTLSKKQEKALKKFERKHKKSL
ncbi:hypothetical protein [Flammeovirga aprica]|uniref:Uncharacterized protein n=1 Tax=Flammeovirga aprica JL-4 TaxID=694437 RepID=A0A7X9RYT1_9BACT|nr:hypothetical protein [Flammeovirga aprica]NME71235.1 hypothetical protein [Flammeovirga aprica JL-4]